MNSGPATPGPTSPAAGLENLAAEARQMLEAVRAIRTVLGPGAEGEAPGDAHAGHPGAAGPPPAEGGAASGAAGADASSVCRSCPVCQLLAVLRQVRPEVVDHLGLAMSELALAARELLGGDRPAGTPSGPSGASSAPSGTAPGAADLPEPPDAPVAPPVEWIEIR